MVSKNKVYSSEIKANVKKNKMIFTRVRTCYEKSWGLYVKRSGLKKTREYRGIGDFNFYIEGKNFYFCYFDFLASWSALFVLFGK